MPGAMGLLRRGLQGSPVRTGLRKTGPEDKSWASGESGLGLRAGSLDKEGGCLVGHLLCTAGQRSLPPLYGLRDGPTPSRSHPCCLRLLSRPLLPSGLLVSPCTAARSFSLMSLVWLPGEWEEGGWERGDGMDEPGLVLKVGRG